MNFASRFQFYTYIVRTPIKQSGKVGTFSMKKALAGAFSRHCKIFLRSPIDRSSKVCRAKCFCLLVFPSCMECDILAAACNITTTDLMTGDRHHVVSRAFVEPHLVLKQQQASQQ